ncbi:hypothetical protein Tco_1365783, partial [Tanacetum coccineum]
MLDVDEEDLDLSERNLNQCKRKICDGHYTMALRVLSSFSVSPYNDATLQELKAKHPFKAASSLPDIPIDHHYLIASQAVVLDRIKSFPQGTSYGRDGLVLGCQERGEAILHVVNRLIEDRRDDVGLSMLLVAFKMPSI